MPLQNRVTPEGEIVATPHRGLYMGNRGGQIHRVDKTLSNRRWTSRAWITCVLEFKGWREQIMAPGRYTQLFFLDEATALAAGHRPCALCRRADYKLFQRLWHDPEHAARPPLATEMDIVLHSERLSWLGQKEYYRAMLQDLPRGAMARVGADSVLKTDHGLHIWSPAGYRSVTHDPGDIAVDVSTPPSIVAVLRQGYRPKLHPSAEAAS